MVYRLINSLILMLIIETMIKYLEIKRIKKEILIALDEAKRNRDYYIIDQLKNRLRKLKRVRLEY